MKHLLWSAALAASLAPFAAAQDRDFLSTGEAAQIREAAQDPNLRITLYVQFARRRIELVKSLLGKEKPGRSVLIHDALEDYAKIIDAVDDVVDDALQHQADIKQGMSVLQGYERDLLPMLKKIRDGQPKDLDRYDFVLTTAINTTSDSLDLAEEDIAERTKDVEHRAQEEQKALDEMKGTADKAADDARQQKTGDTAPKDQPQPQPQKKPPTLLKPGEKPATLGQPGGKQQ
jgi:hypothetical protein